MRYRKILSNLRRREAGSGFYYLTAKLMIIEMDLHINEEEKVDSEVNLTLTLNPVINISLTLEV